jgi:CHASE3 domain sensor protein
MMPSISLHGIVVGKEVILVLIIIIIIIIIMSILSYLFTCKLNSPKTNYKVSMSMEKETKHKQNTKARKFI